MYLPANFKEQDTASIRKLIRDYPFATLITSEGSAPCVGHLPVLLSDETESSFRLVSHMAKANPQWRHFENQELLLVFHGPHTYVTPSWYRQAENVPTWNYAVAHVHAKARVVTEASRLDEILRQTVEHFEKASPNPWRYDLSDDLKADLMKAIVGFEIEPLRIEAKFKLSQNRSEEDRLGVLEGLKTRADEMSRGVLRLMQRG